MKKPPTDPQIRAEFDELDVLIDRFEEFDGEERIEIGRRWLEFMKRYGALFGFSDEQIADTEEAFARYAASHQKMLLAEHRAVQAKIASELADRKLEQSLLEASKHYGRPFMFPAYKTGNRNSGN